jgi:hypothetical protein
MFFFGMGALKICASAKNFLFQAKIRRANKAVCKMPFNLWLINFVETA